MEQKTDKLQMTDRNEEIDLKELFYYLREKIVLIIVVFVVGLVGAGLFTKFLIKPVYKATAKLYVVSNSGKSVVNLDDLRLGTTLSADYQELLKIRPLLTEIASDLGLDYTYTQLQSMIEVSPVADTRILFITASSHDAEEARDIANAMVKKATTYLPKLMAITAPNIAEEAIVPSSPSSPSLAKNALMGGILGAMLVIGILTVLFIMDDTVKTSEDIERMIGVMPLTLIPENTEKTAEKRKKGQGKAYGEQ